MEENDDPTSPSRLHHGHSASGSGFPSTNSGLNSKAKKGRRTKTGCLTCRKRRIKCGEEKPICANCIKSKRNCEGYSQPIVWKSHTEGWTAPYNPIAYQPYGQFVATAGYAPGTAFSTVPAQRHFGIPLDQYGNQVPITEHMTSPIGLSSTQYELPSFHNPAHQPHSNAFSQFSPVSANIPGSVDGAQAYVAPESQPQLSPPLSQNFHQLAQNPPQSYNLPYHPSPTPQNAVPRFVNQGSTSAATHPAGVQETGGSFVSQRLDGSMDVDDAPKLEESNLAQASGTSWRAIENSNTSRRSLNRQFSGT
jgi:Zn(2)-Cys(6) binuclear cluster domain-containing protein